MIVTDAGRDARKITYKHAGNPAYAGLGLFFGGLKCKDHSSFVLAIRAEKPTSLDVKACAPGKTVFTARFPIGTGWQELAIPFDQLKGDNGGFDASKLVEKIEFQPAPDTTGNALYLGEFKLAK